MNPAEMMFTAVLTVPSVPSGTVLSVSAPLRTAATTRTASITMNGLTAGSGVLLCLSQYVGVMESVVGTLNGAYTKVFGFEDGNDNGMEYFIFLNSAAGNETINITAVADAGATYLSGSAIEVAGLGAADKTGSTSSGVTVTASGPNSQAKMFVVTGATWDTDKDAGFTTPVGYTLIDRENAADKNSATQYAYKVVNAVETSTSTITATTSTDVDCSIVTFLLQG